MDEFESSLDSLLRQYFHVVPTHTNRHDQWYKRVTHAWRERNGESGDPLILTAKESKDEWAPKMLRLAADLSKYIEDAAIQEERAQDAIDAPSNDKLFPDAVLDVPAIMAQPQNEEKPALTPLMQRGSFWASASKLGAFRDTVVRLEQARAVKALLERDELASLLYLAKQPNAAIAGAAQVQAKQGYRRGTEDQGWETIIDEILHVLFFLGILRSFQDELLRDEKYQQWVPFGLLSSDTPATRFIEALQLQGARQLQTKGDVRRHLERCFRVLVKTHVLHGACRLPPVDWKGRISNSVLYFVGFESWNRERQGDGYLGCDLNTAKDATWLREGLDKADELDVDKGQPVKPKSPRPRDPLLLHDPKREPEPVPGDAEEMEKLAALEAEETAYGAKRSTKYQRKRANS